MIFHRALSLPLTWLIGIESWRHIEWREARSGCWWRKWHARRWRPLTKSSRRSHRWSLGWIGTWCTHRWLTKAWRATIAGISLRGTRWKASRSGGELARRKTLRHGLLVVVRLGSLRLWRGIVACHGLIVRRNLRITWVRRDWSSGSLRYRCEHWCESLLGDVDAVGAGFSGEPALCFVTVALAFAVFLECVCDCDLLVHEVVAVHDFDGLVGCFETVV